MSLAAPVEPATTAPRRIRPPRTDAISFADFRPRRLLSDERIAALYDGRRYEDVTSPDGKSTRRHLNNLAA